MKNDYRYTQNRELSWLKFDLRVLAEAQDPTVPVLERLKFLEIFSSNLDEFFMVRVGSLTDLALMKEQHADNKSGMLPAEQLDAIFKECRHLYALRDKTFHSLELELAACNICRRDPAQLEDKDKKSAEHWFRHEILPLLSPQIIDIHHPFPHLINKSLNIVLRLKMEGRECFGIIPIPDSLPSLYRLSHLGAHYVLIEDLISCFAGELFPEVEILDRAVVSVTRSADIVPEEVGYNMDEDYRELMKKVIRKRTRLAPVRLEIQGDKRETFSSYLCEKLGLDKKRVFTSKTPLRLGYIYSITKLLPEASAALLSDTPYDPRPCCLDCSKPLIPQVLKRDSLLFFPFESMDPFVKLVREAASDPSVLSIKITIYRLAAKPKLADYLCRAAENGKQVTVLVELRARFDEQNNIGWAERMEEAGCTVLYGSDYVKVHSKICQITRKENGQLQYITQVGTGNYNEKTAKLYTDLSLITADPVVGEDANHLFMNLAISNYSGIYQKLLASPYQLKDRVLQMIDQEIKKGEDGYLFFKLNSLTDRQIIDKLAEASQAGVTCEMNIRGICCLRPGIEGLTDHIKVYSIVGRYLEHARIYQFGRGEDALLYISSADFMTRNTEHRVEIACPVEDERTREKIFKIIDAIRRDTVKKRILFPDGTYHVAEDRTEDFNSQEYFMQNELCPAEDPLPDEAEEAREANREGKRARGFLAWFRSVMIK